MDPAGLDVTASPTQVSVGSVVILCNNMENVGGSLGSGPLLRLATARWGLTGTNSYTGGTVVNQGTLVVTSPLALCLMARVLSSERAGASYSTRAR